MILASGGVGAGFTAFLVVLGLGVAAFFLLRSMTRHLKNVPKTFDTQAFDVDHPPMRPTGHRPPRLPRRLQEKVDRAEAEERRHRNL